jgi:hypothetical protein
MWAISFTHEVCNLLANPFSGSKVLQLAHGTRLIHHAGHAGRELMVKGPPPTDQVPENALQSRPEFEVDTHRHHVPNWRILKSLIHRTPRKWWSRLQQTPFQAEYAADMARRFVANLADLDGPIVSHGAGDCKLTIQCCDLMGAFVRSMQPAVAQLN